MAGTHANRPEQSDERHQPNVKGTTNVRNTVCAADNQQIVIDTIKDTENAKLLFTNYYITKGKQLSVASEVMTNVPEPVAEDLLSIIEYVHNFYPDSEEAKTELPGCGALVASVEPTPLHRDDTAEIVGMFQFEIELGELNMCVPSMDYADITHRLIDHMYKSIKAYIDDPRPMSEKIGEEIEKELENLK